MSKRKSQLEQAVRDALSPLSVECEVRFEYPDRYLGSGDRVGFVVVGLAMDEESEPLHREPYWAYSAAGVEAWIEEARRKVSSLGYQLSEWKKPAWMSEVLQPGDDMDEEDTEG